MQVNAMELNVLKYSVISFKRVFLRHTLAGSLPHLWLCLETWLQIQRPCSDPEFFSKSVWRHTYSTAARANSLLGFIQRFTRDFRQPHTLEYGTPQDSGTTYSGLRLSLSYQLNHIHIRALDNIRTRFIRQLGFELGYTYLNSPISRFESDFNLQPLQLRRSLSHSTD